MCFYTTDLFICASELHVTRSLNKLRLTYHSPLDSVRGVVGVLPPAAADANVLGAMVFEGKFGAKLEEEGSDGGDLTSVGLERFRVEC